jgi:hypothetical protein
MKKSYLLLMIFASFRLTSISQNISSSNYPDTIVGKYTEGIIEEHLIITNTGSASMSMHVYRNTIDMPGNTVNYYCWGPNCFPPTTSLSTDPVFLGSGKSDSSFVAYLEPNQEEGITLVEFSFFDELGSGDSLKLNLVFKTVPPPISVWELEKQNNLNSIYPNPAKDLAFMRYDVSSNVNANLEIYDLVGKKVKSLNLASGSNNLLFSVNEFESGIYLCNLVIDGKIIDTEKLVVQ